MCLRGLQLRLGIKNNVPPQTEISRQSRCVSSCVCQAVFHVTLSALQFPHLQDDARSAALNSIQSPSYILPERLNKQSLLFVKKPQKRSIRIHSVQRLGFRHANNYLGTPQNMFTTASNLALTCILHVSFRNNNNNKKSNYNLFRWYYDVSVLL